jgi:hypothetical protein
LKESPDPTRHKGDISKDLIVLRISSINSAIMKRIILLLCLAICFCTNAQVCFDPATVYPAGSGINSMSSADFNNDSYPDIVVANWGTGLSLLLGTGTGSFGAPIKLTAGSTPSSAIGGDFNGDGLTDMAVTNYYSNNISILLGTGNGSFSTPSNFGVGSMPLELVTTDFNGDGKADIAVACDGSTSSIWVLLGTGTGSFGTATAYGGGSDSHSICCADFNKDGKMDIAIVNRYGSCAKVLLGTGTGSFAAASTFLTGAYPISIVSADFNKDGTPDLAVSNISSNTISVLLGTGSGSFGSAINIVTGTNPWTLTSDDFNGDGNPDIAVVLNGLNVTSVFLGNGTGGFGSANNFAIGTSPRSILSGDFNRDNKRDLISGNWSSSDISVLLNFGYTFVENHSICAGTSYLWHGTNYTVAGDYTAKYTSIHGCDSIYRLHLSLNPVYSFSENHSICAGDAYNWRGTNYSTNGTYTAKYTNISGCDSIYSLNLTVNQLPKDLNSSTGLVAYYPFNNNANDESGHNNNGTLYGPTPVADRDSKANSAFQFNGSSNYILIGNPVPASLQIQNEITLSAWIYATQYPASSTLGLIVGSQCDNCGYRGVTIFLDGRLNSDGQPSPVGHIHFQIGNGSWHLTNTNSQVPLNQWVHIVATRKANEAAKIYYNGVSQPLTSVDWNGTISYSGTYLAIGRQKDYENRFFNGKIDEVRMYNRALSEAEVKTLYQDMKMYASSDTVCYNNSTSILLAHPESGISYQLLKNDVETGTPQTGSGSALIFNTDNLNATSNFSVKAKNTATNCTLTLDSVLTITVNPEPVVSLAAIDNFININATAIHLNGSPAGGTYAGKGISGTTFDPKSAGLGLKTISYSYTNTSGCSANAIQTTIVYDTTGVACSRYDTTYISVTDTLYIHSLVTGHAAPYNLNTIKVFPNPADNHITIDYGNYLLMNGYSMKITNSQGQNVFTALINKQTSYIDLNGWTGAGVYFVHIIDPTSNIISIKKIIIK